MKRKYSKAYRTAQKYLSSKRSPIFRSAKKGLRRTARVLKSEGRRAGRFIGKRTRKYAPVAGRAIRDYAYSAKQEHSRFSTPEDIYFGRATYRERPTRSSGKMIRRKQKVKVKYVYISPGKYKRRKQRQMIRYIEPTMKRKKKKKRIGRRQDMGYFGGLPRTVASDLY